MVQTLEERTLIPVECEMGLMLKDDSTGMGYTNMFTDESSICLEINIYLYLAAAICLLHGYHAGMQLPLKSSGMAGS